MEGKEVIRCPKCGQEEEQNKQGYSCAGSQRYLCKHCGCKYTPIKKPRGYSEKVRRKAMRLMVDGMSGRAIGRQLGISKANAYRWAKKTGTVWISPRTDLSAYECDEVYWFINRRKGYEKGINTYIMTMISREPRQILSFAVDRSINKYRKKLN